MDYSLLNDKAQASMVSTSPCLGDITVKVTV